MSNVIKDQVLLDELHEMLAEVIDIEPELLGYDTHFINDLGVDSLLALEILVTLERQYKVELSEQDLQQIYSLRKLYELMEARIAQTHS